MAVAAARPVVRSLRWGPLVGAGAAGLVLVWLLRPHRPVPSASLGSLRLAAFILAAGAAFVLDDQAAVTLASSPTPLHARRVLRLATVGAALGCSWAATVALALAVSPAGSTLSVGAATLEMAAMVTFTIAAAATAAPLAPDGLGGIAGAPSLTLLLLCANVGQERWPAISMFPTAPGDPAWVAAHGRWGFLLAAAVLAVALNSRDPARR